MAPQVPGVQGQVTATGGLGELIEGRNAILRPAISVTTTTTTASPAAAAAAGRAPDCECVESSECRAQEAGHSTDFFCTQI